MNKIKYLFAIVEVKIITPQLNDEYSGWSVFLPNFIFPYLENAIYNEQTKIPTPNNA